MNKVDIDTIALLVSVLAIIITWIFSASQKRHNRNSVRPVCNIIVRDLPDSFTIMLCNYGVGPMRICNIRCVKNGIESNKHHVTMFFPKDDSIEKNYSLYVVGRTLSVNDKINLVSVKCKDEKERNRIRGY